MQVRTERRQPLDLGGVAERDHRLGGERLEPLQRLAGALAERLGDVLGEAYHPAVGHLGMEAEAVRRGRRHQDGGRRGERQARRLEGHLAAAALNQKNLEQIAMPVRADQPVVRRGARRDGFDMDEVERLIVRRIAIKMKQRQRRHRGHGARIGEWPDFGNRRGGRTAPLVDKVDKRRPRRTGEASLDRSTIEFN